MIVQRIGLALMLFLLLPAESHSQERIKIAYSSADASNTVWFTALDAGLYKKHGLDVELVFIQSSTMSVSTVVSGDIQVANTSGGAVASAVVGGAHLIMTACYINTLPYELVVQETVKSAEELRGKSVGISRVGSASDVAARVLVKGLGLEPVKDVPIIQVGGPSERAAASTGRIGFLPETEDQGYAPSDLISTAIAHHWLLSALSTMKLSRDKSRHNAAADDGAH
jgi:NitT/TauT family transport system substrate-binding protein